MFIDNILVLQASPPCAEVGWLMRQLFNHTVVTQVAD